MATLKAYLWAFILAGALALAGGVYAKGRLDASHAAETASLRASLKGLEDAAEADRLKRIADTVQAKIDREELAALELTYKDLLNDLQTPDAECLLPRDADRLRDASRHR